MNRRILMLSMLVLFVIAASPALAPAEVKTFDAKAFEAAQSAGDSVVLAINATW